MKNDYVELVKLLCEEKENVEGFHVDMEKETVENENYRKVLFTAKNIQLVVMSLKANEEIGMETHEHGAQFIRVDGGSGTTIMNGKEYPLKDGDAIVIPEGVEHNVIASKEGLKLYVLYTPPEHEDGLVEKNKL
jgi:quercetin dioxygenase-like cupin family protein